MKWLERLMNVSPIWRIVGGKQDRVNELEGEVEALSIQLERVLAAHEERIQDLVDREIVLAQIAELALKF